MQMRWKNCVLLIPTVFILFSASVQAEKIGDDRVLTLITDMKSSYADLVHMQCRFTKDIVIEGRNIPRTVMLFRFKKTPKTIYLEFLNRFEGRKCLYIEGENDNKILVRPDGFLQFITLNVDPLDDRAMAESTEPIMEMVFGPIIESVDKWLRKSLTDQRVKFDLRDDYLENGRPYIRLFGKWDAGDDFLLILIDRKTFSPYKLEYRHGNNYGHFLYEDIEINGGLTDSDFEI